MAKHFLSPIIFIGTISLSLSACSNQSADKITSADSTATVIENTDVNINDSLALQTHELTKIYTQAVAQFIKAVSQKNKSVFDTLFFGKHDQFPDIKLPETIENVKIKILSPEDTMKLQEQRKSNFYINMVGWGNKNSYEFIFVTFSNGAEHKYDCILNYKYNTTRKKFELDKLRFEDYILNKEKKVERIAVYENGKYVGDKVTEENKK